MSSDKNLEKKSVFVLFGRLWTMFYKRIPAFFNITVGLTIVSAVLPFLLSHVQGWFIDSLISVINGNASLVVIYYALGYIVLVLSVASIVDFLLDYYLGVRLFYPVAEGSAAIMMHKKASLDLGFYDNSDNITLMNHADDAEKLIAGYFKFIFDTFFVSIISFCVAGVVLLQFSPVLVVVLLASTGLFIYIQYSSSTDEVRRWKGKTLLKKHTGTVRSFFRK